MKIGIIGMAAAASVIQANLRIHAEEEAGLLPGWVLDPSPFAHAPKLPGGSLGGVGLVALSVVAAALVIVGTRLYERRDIAV